MKTAYSNLGADIAKLSLSNNIPTLVKAIEIKGKHFMAQSGIEPHKIKYQFLYRCFYNKGFVKAGDVIRVLDVVTDIDSINCSTDKILGRISFNSLMDTNLFIQLD